MIIYKRLNKLDIIKLNNFISKYIHLYPDYLQEEINSKLLLGFTNNNDIINQIYIYLDIVDSRINPYLYFYHFMKEKFDLNSKLLEVGSGTIPILAYIIENNSNMKVDCIDPLITFNQLTKGNIMIKEFDNETDIENYSLIFGYNPCGVTETLIRHAIEHSKDFCIALCGCSFLSDNCKDITPEKWHEYLYNLSKTLTKDKSYEIGKVFFPKRYQITWPIIYGKNLENKGRRF